jgi:hypothetical protein
LLGLVFAASFAQHAAASLTILEGEHTVIYDIVNPRGVAFIPDYSNESFEQHVTSLDEFSKRVNVTSKMHPLKSRVPYPAVPGTMPRGMAQYLIAERERQADDPSLIRLVREITGDAKCLHEAAYAILSWIADHIVFDTSITAATDAVSALRTRKAYCVGYSNLAVAMLRAAGIPARVAHGCLPSGYEWGFSKDYWGVKVNDGGYHAYIELFYPGTGWVFRPAQDVPAVPAPATVDFRGGVATGVVIDGRGLGLRPALLPRIVDQQEQEVYVGQIVTRTNAVEQGVAGYARDVKASSNNFRVTDNPAVIKGLSASGTAKTDIMIAQADAEVLRQLSSTGDFLQYCRVTIVY